MLDWLTWQWWQGERPTDTEQQPIWDTYGAVGPHKHMLIAGQEWHGLA